jgi:release factor glutamine methyltransferase
MLASDYFIQFSQRLSGHPKEEHQAIFKELLHFHKVHSNGYWPNLTLENKIIAEIDKQLIALNTQKPLQYVLGLAPFYNVDIKVSEHTLIPRSETEELVHLILEENKGSALNVLDIGTGSGCIPVILLKNRPQWNALGLDIDAKAIKIAQLNARQLKLSSRLTFKKVDVLKENFDLKDINILVSNPPYIDESEKATMSKTVLNFEPQKALFTLSGDPLIFYKRIAREMELQNFKGKAYFEINPIYDEQMLDIFKSFSPTLSKDMQQKNRFLLIS